MFSCGHLLVAQKFTIPLARKIYIRRFNAAGILWRKQTVQSLVKSIEIIENSGSDLLGHLFVMLEISFPMVRNKIPRPLSASFQHKKTFCALLTFVIT
jgi:hypothetical protein